VKVPTVAAVLAALGIGIAVPLVFDDEGHKRRELSRAEVESRLRTESLVIPAGRSKKRVPDKVACRRATRSTYSCTVTFLGDRRGDPITAYDLTMSAFEPSTAEREARLRGMIAFSYRRVCHRRPPVVTVRCDAAGQICQFDAGDSRGVVRYDESPERIVC
jgi:hypothetical protein